MFQLVFDDEGDEEPSVDNAIKGTPDQPSLKARTAALLAEEAASKARQEKAKERRKNRGGDDDDDAADQDKPQISKKKLKQLTRPSVAALKQEATRPDVVEMWDVCAKDPSLLVYLKSYRNTVPVPKHWCAKRKYLQGKRGFEKPPFRLPEFIARTGIMEMRQTVADKVS